MKISILIPVFNAQRQLRRSLDSIATQTFDGEIEICAVDDCSTDSSRKILDEFKTGFEASEKHTMKIVSHARNCGVAAARNTALDTATGDYICFVDADDELAKDALSKAAEACASNDADVAGWDWTLFGPSSSRYMRQPDCKTPEEALKAMMGGTLRWNLWLFMVRREMWDGIRFTDGMNMGEDMMGMLRVLMKAGNLVQIHESGYSYHQTSESISKTMSDSNLLQSCSNLDTAVEHLMQSRYSYLANPYVSLLKLNVKLPLLVSLDKNDYIRWWNCYPEAATAIMKNRHLPPRTKILQLMAARRFWAGVKLYNKLVYGLICGLLAHVK